MTDIVTMSDEQFEAWLMSQLPSVDPTELVARIHRLKAEALQSPFQNVWLAGGQVPACVERGHRIYHWSYESWQVFQHGDHGEARFAYLWDTHKRYYTESEYLEDWEAMLDRVRQWVNGIHAWEERAVS